MNNQPRPGLRRWMRAGLLALAVPLVVGSKCVFLFSSGGSGDDEDGEGDREDTAVVVQAGRLVADPVAGLRYESGSLSGVTGAGGEFRFEAGGSVRFLIGDIQLGEKVPGEELLTPVDLVPGGSPDSPAVVNIVRLLKSLDAIPGDDVITLPPAIHDQARLDDPLAGAAIEQLDFQDPVVFVNAASQLVAVLTDQYGHTATLVDAGAAREALRRTTERRDGHAIGGQPYPGVIRGDP